VPREPTLHDFGQLIAIVLPGFTALWATTYVSDALRPWFGLSPPAEPTLGGFLLLGLASIAAGVTVSTLRWLVIDPIHHRTGVQPPRLGLLAAGQARGGVPARGGTTTTAGINATAGW